MNIPDSFLELCRDGQSNRLLYVTSVILVFIGLFYRFLGTQYQDKNLNLLISKPFAQILECIEYADATSCFQKHRNVLEKQLSSQLSTNASSMMKNCFEFATSEGNDIKLVLKIQQCVHNSEIFDVRVEQVNNEFPRYTSNSTNFVLYIGLIMTMIAYGVWTIRIKETSPTVAKVPEQVSGVDLNEVRSSLYEINKLQRKLHGMHVAGSAMLSAIPKHLTYDPMVFPSSESVPFCQYNKRSLFPSPAYDIASTENEMKNTANSSLNSKHFTNKFKSDDTRIKQAFKNSVLQALEAKNYRWNNSMVEKKKSNIPSTTQITLHYKDVTRTDREGRKFKRVFIPGRGWVSMKSVEEEEAQLGSDSIVRSIN